MKRLITGSLAAAAMVLGGLCAGQSAQAEPYGVVPVPSQPVHNFYVQDPHYGYPAEMYVAPITTPPYVGYTHITYPPFAPHEFLYQHHRTYYHSYNGGRGFNRTKVNWYRAPQLLKARNPLF